MDDVSLVGELERTADIGEVTEIGDILEAGEVRIEWVREALLDGKRKEVFGGASGGANFNL